MGKRLSSLLLIAEARSNGQYITATHLKRGFAHFSRSAIRIRYNRSALATLALHYYRRKITTATHSPCGSQLKAKYENIYFSFSSGDCKLPPPKSNNPSGVHKKPSFLFNPSLRTCHGISGRDISWFFAAFRSASSALPHRLHS